MKTDLHAENKRLFAIDCLHSNTPGLYWQCKMSGNCNTWGDFRENEKPQWLDGLIYRRKPDAPVWKKQADIIGRLTEFMRPKTKYGHIKQGDRVLAWDNNYPQSFKMRRYFSHEYMGWCFCYVSGADEWSSEGHAHLWDNCELWTGDE